jgi:hypothetical protein
MYVPYNSFLINLRNPFLGCIALEFIFVIFHLWRYSQIKCHLIHLQTYNVTTTESFPRLTNTPTQNLRQRMSRITDVSKVERVSESSYVRGLLIYGKTLIKLASKNVHSTVRPLVPLSSLIHSPPLPLSVS